jgi:hypothetical protein
LDVNIKINSILKKYAKTKHETFWHLIFSTTIYPMTEYCERGISKVSSALTTARDYLRTLDQVTFDQIWYTNLMTRPVQVWPFSLGESLC